MQFFRVRLQGLRLPKLFVALPEAAYEESGDGRTEAATEKGN
jgi:hypothetical protein